MRVMEGAKQRRMDEVAMGSGMEGDGRCMGMHAHAREGASEAEADGRGSDGEREMVDAGDGVVGEAAMGGIGGARRGGYGR